MHTYLQKFVIFCGLGLAFGATAGTASAAYRIKMPWRGDSLPANTYFVATGNHTGCDFGNEPCELDIGALRWDSTLDDWSESKIVGDADWSETVLSDDPIYGAPLYSPVDGEIVSCWAGMDDRTVPSVNPCTSCIGAGNHVTIRTADGRIVFLGHLKKNSIPSSLCPSPNRGTTNAPDGDEDTACDSVTNGWTKISSDLVLSTPIEVHKGDLIGSVGATGTMGGDPHLHFHVKPVANNASGELCVGFPEEIRFDEGFIQDQLADTFPVDADWGWLLGSAVPWLGNAFSLLWGEPSGILVDSVDVEQATVPALALTGGLAAPGGVAAYINSSGNFEAVGFGHDSAGLMTLAASNTQGAVNQVELAPVSASGPHVVAAVRNSANKLLLIPYFVQANHTLVKGTAPAASAGTISLVEATRSPNHDGIVTAVKDSSSNLKVENFGASASGTNLTVTARGTDTSSSAVSHIDIATLTAGRALGEGIGVTPFTGVVTVEERTSDHTAFLRTWSIDASGNTVALDSSVQIKDDSNAAFVVEDVQVTTIGDGTREFPVVAVRRTSDDRMFLLAYEVASTGTPTRLSQIQTGPVTEISLAEGGLRDAIVGVRTSGALSLLSFSTGVDGKLRRVGTRDGGTITDVAVDGNAPGRLMVSAVIDGSGELVLHSFNTNYSSAL